MSYSLSVSFSLSLSSFLTGVWSWHLDFQGKIDTYIMVTQVAHVCPLLKINFKFVAVVDLNKYLKLIKEPILLHICTPISEFPSNISTMVLQD